MKPEELLEEARKVLSEIKYLDYEFEVRLDGDEGVLLRATYMDLDIYTKRPERQYTAWVSVNTKAGISRVVSGAFKVCFTSAEHRCREAFLYRGRRIFGPHFHVDDLHMLCADREDAGQ